MWSITERFVLPSLRRCMYVCMYESNARLDVTGIEPGNGVEQQLGVCVTLHPCAGLGGGSIRRPGEGLFPDHGNPASLALPALGRTDRSRDLPTPDCHTELPASVQHRTRYHSDKSSKRVLTFKHAVARVQDVSMTAYPDNDSSFMVFLSPSGQMLP